MNISKNLSTLIFLLSILSCWGAYSQALFVPGTIGTSVNAGNVGIGTSAPTSPLQINGSVPELNLQIYNTSANGARTFLSAFPGKSAVQTDKDFAIMTNGGGWTNKLLVTNAGNVGIGTSTPSSKLEVAGDIRTNQQYIITGIGAVDQQASNLKIWANNSLTLGAGGGSTANLMVIPNGNVGIGTSSPTQKLHLAGTSSTYLNIDKAADSNEAGVLFSRAGSTLFYLYNDDIGNALKIQASGLSGEVDATPRMQFPLSNKNIYMAQSGGNVGINTSNPDAKLTVKGNIHAEEVRVDLSVPGPDYVFEKNYDLLTLAELENYINQNNHLPEVPAAKEMEANGVNLGEMNMLLLKKVEELTLYVIELKKENEKQQAQIKTLENKK